MNGGFPPPEPPLLLVFTLYSGSWCQEEKKTQRSSDVTPTLTVVGRLVSENAASAYSSGVLLFTPGDSYCCRRHPRVEAAEQ